MNKINIDKKAFIGIFSGFVLWNVCFFLMQLILPSLRTRNSAIIIVMSVCFFLIPFISGLLAGLIAGKKELLIALSSIFFAYLPWLIAGNRLLKIYDYPYVENSIFFIVFIYVLIASFFGGLVALLIRKKKRSKLREEKQTEVQNGKRIFISIILGIIAGYFLFFLGVLILMIPKNWNFRIILTGVIFVVSSFTMGFVSGWLAKKRELLIAFLTFLIGYILPTYRQLQAMKESALGFNQIVLQVFFSYLSLMLFALLGGFVAKTIRQKQEKDSVDQ